MKFNYKLAGSTASAIILGTPLAFLCFYMGTDTQAKSLNITILILGSLMGWILGIIVTPYGPKEKEEFSVYTKAVSAFVSGYLVAKTDKLIEYVFSTEFLSNPLSSFRMMLFVSILLLAVIITFIYRKYA